MEDVALPLEEKEELIGVSSGYVARLTLESIGELFHAADQIKDWLATCARLVSSCVAQYVLLHCARFH